MKINFKKITESFYINGLVFSAKQNLTKIFLNIIVFVVSLKIHNLIEISSRIPVESHVKEKEELIVLIYVLNYATVENASLANMKGP